jgi:hypothetical protein
MSGVPDAFVLYIRGWRQMALLPYDLFSWNKITRSWDMNTMPWNIIAVYIQMVISHSDYILCAWWVLLVTPDSSSSLLNCSMRVLPLPLLLINCLSFSPHWRAPPFPPPGLTPFPSGFRHLPASSSATSGISQRLLLYCLCPYIFYFI